MAGFFFFEGEVNKRLPHGCHVNFVWYLFFLVEIEMSDASLPPTLLLDALSLSLSLPFSCGKSQPMMLVHRPSMVDALKVSHLLEAVIDYNSRNGKTPSWHVTGQFTLNLHLHFMVVHTHIILSMGELVNINRSLIQEQKGYHTELIVHVEARYHSWFLGYIHDLIG